MAHEYQAVFSLGDNCSSAAQIRMKGLRICSGPLDWLGTGDSLGLERLLLGRFKDFMLFDNLKFCPLVMKDTESGVDYWRFGDSLYAVQSAHDVPKCAEQPQYTDFGDFHKKLRRRVERFLWCVDHLDSMLFVRKVNKGRDHFVRLSSVLGDLRGGRPYHLFGVVLDSSTEDFSGIEHTTVFKATRGFSYKRDLTDWRFLDQVTLKECPDFTKLYQLEDVDQGP